MRMQNYRIRRSCRFEVIEKDPEGTRVDPRRILQYGILFLEGKALEALYKYIKTKYDNSVVGIVYCMTKQQSEDVANYLFDRGILADFYHAGQSSSDRELVQDAWQRGEIKVVCATIAYESWSCRGIVVSCVTGTAWESTSPTCAT